MNQLELNNRGKQITMEINEKNKRVNFFKLNNSKTLNINLL